MNNYFTIINTFDEQMQRIAKESVRDIINDIPLDDFKELIDSNEKDVNGYCYGDWLQDYIENSHFHEWFDYIDIYYSQTASRGDSGEVCESFRELLEENHLDYILQESEEFQRLEGLQRANYLVNLCGQALCMNYIYDALPSKKELKAITKKRLTTENV